MRRRRTVLLAGPTASGKSDLALALAERLDAIVVNADSMQVYRDLRILTARPSPEEEARAPHRLYGHVDGADAYSVGRWAAAVAALLDAPGAAGRPVVFVGGTGLYFEALTRGLADIPPVPDAVRRHWRSRSLRDDPLRLHAELMLRDPVTAARLRRSDPQRIVRALEVADGTGRPLSEWQAQDRDALVDVDGALRLVLAPQRAVLRDRIAARFESMMDEGALGEVEALLARDLPGSLPVMKALGVRPLAAHLAGDSARAEAVAAAVAETRRYAKRQLTWFRGRMSDWTWLSPESADPDSLARALDAGRA